MSHNFEGPKNIKNNRKSFLKTIVNTMFIIIKGNSFFCLPFMNNNIADLHFFFIYLSSLFVTHFWNKLIETKESLHQKNIKEYKDFTIG